VHVIRAIEDEVQRFDLFANELVDPVQVFLEGSVGFEIPGLVGSP
jgi:hypothetical protein